MPDQTQLKRPNFLERWEVRWCANCGNLYNLNRSMELQTCTSCGAHPDHSVLVAVLNASYLAQTAEFTFFAPTPALTTTVTLRTAKRPTKSNKGGQHA